jgi:hypothetical protein
MTKAHQKPVLPEATNDQQPPTRGADGIFHLGAEAWEFCQETAAHPDKRLAQAEVLTLGIGKGFCQEAYEEFTERPQELMCHIGGYYIAGTVAAVFLEALPPVAIATLALGTGYAVWSYFNDKENQKRFASVSKATSQAWYSNNPKDFNKSVDTISSALGKDSFQLSTALMFGWYGAEFCPFTVPKISPTKAFQPLSATTGESIKKGITNIKEWLPSAIGSANSKTSETTPALPTDKAPTNLPAKPTNDSTPISLPWKEKGRFDLPFNYKRAVTDTQKQLERQDYFLPGSGSVRDLLEYVVLSDYKDLAGRYIPTIENFLKDPACDELLAKLPKGCSFLGAGAKRIGLLMPNNRVAVIGPVEEIPPCALALQPLDSPQVIGRYQLDIVPYAESRGITQNDLSLLCKQLRDIGWRAVDPTKINIGKLLDGTLVVSDRDAVAPRPRLESMNPAKIINSLKTYLQSFSKLDLAEQTAVTADQIAELYGQTGDIQNTLRYKLIAILKHSNNHSLDEPFMVKRFESIQSLCNDHKLYRQAIDLLTERLWYPVNTEEERASLVWLQTLFGQTSRLAEQALTKHRLQKLELENPEAKL